MDKLNSRQRRFVYNIISGMSQKDAYIKAGYSPDGAEQHASRLMTYASVRREIERINNKQVANIENELLSPIEKRAILARIARASLTDFIGEDGEPELNKDTPNKEAAKSFTHKKRTIKRGDNWEDLVTKDIKLLDPIEAIREDNKMMGDYAPTKHQVSSYNVSVSLNPKSRRGENALQGQGETKRITEGMGSTEETECRTDVEP